MKKCHTHTCLNTSSLEIQVSQNQIFIEKLNIHIKFRCRKIMLALAIHGLEIQIVTWSDHRCRIWIQDCQNKRKEHKIVDMGYCWIRVIQEYYKKLLSRSCWCSTSIWYYQEGNIQPSYKMAWGSTLEWKSWYHGHVNRK